MAIHCARVAGTPMPAAEVLERLEQMVIDRQGPVLDNDPRGGRLDALGTPSAAPRGDTLYLPRRTPLPITPATIAAAVVLIGELLTSTVLTLVFVPAFVNHFQEVTRAS